MLVCSVVVTVRPTAVYPGIEVLEPFQQIYVVVEVFGMKIQHIDSVSGMVAPRPHAVVVLLEIEHAVVVRTLFRLTESLEPTGQGCLFSTLVVPQSCLNLFFRHRDLGYFRNLVLGVLWRSPSSTLHVILIAVRVSWTHPFSACHSGILVDLVVFQATEGRIVSRDD